MNCASKTESVFTEKCEDSEVFVSPLMNAHARILDFCVDIPAVCPKPGNQTKDPKNLCLNSSEPFWGDVFCSLYDLGKKGLFHDEGHKSKKHQATIPLARKQN